MFKCYSETLEFNVYSIRFDWFRFDSVRKVRQNEIELLIFFQIFMIRFGRIELAIDSNKALDSKDSMQKRLSTRVMKIWKKILKIRNSFGRNFPYLLVRFDLNLVRIKFESFTGFISNCQKIVKILKIFQIFLGVLLKWIQKKCKNFSESHRKSISYCTIKTSYLSFYTF